MTSNRALPKPPIGNSTRVTYKGGTCAFYECEKESNLIMLNEACMCTDCGKPKHPHCGFFKHCGCKTTFFLHAFERRYNRALGTGYVSLFSALLPKVPLGDIQAFEKKYLERRESLDTSRKECEGVEEWEVQCHGASAILRKPILVLHNENEGTLKNIGTLIFAEGRKDFKWNVELRSLVMKVVDNVLWCTPPRSKNSVRLLVVAREPAAEDQRRWVELVTHTPARASLSFVTRSNHEDVAIPRGPSAAISTTLQPPSGQLSSLDDDEEQEVTSPHNTGKPANTPTVSSDTCVSNLLSDKGSC